MEVAWSVYSSFRQKGSPALHFAVHELPEHSPCSKIIAAGAHAVEYDAARLWRVRLD
jgi:hypothetical protein